MDEKNNLLENCLELFSLNKIDRDIFSWTGKNVGWARVFGGQVMAQTLIAAYKTIEKDNEIYFQYHPVKKKQKKIFKRTG